MFIRNIGVVFVVVVVEGVLGVLLLKMVLESMIKKKHFHTRKKFRFSMTTRVRSQLAYSEDAPSPIYL
jgi:hypothetical protein